MEGIKHIQKIREYCDYIEQHLTFVKKSWDIIKNSCKDMNIIYDDHLFYYIDAMVEMHDVSKISVEEFIPYQQYFFPTYNKDNTNFDSAWEHHLDNNPHHWEKWAKMDELFPNEQSCHCVCMVVDWMAMGMKFGDTAESYYKKNKDKIIIPEWAVLFYL